jgi:hypothetical protein
MPHFFKAGLGTEARRKCLTLHRHRLHGGLLGGKVEIQGVFCVVM